MCSGCVGIEGSHLQNNVFKMFLPEAQQGVDSHPAAWLRRARPSLIFMASISTSGNEDKAEQDGRSLDRGRSFRQQTHLSRTTLADVISDLVHVKMIHQGR